MYFCLLSATCNTYARFITSEQAGQIAISFFDSNRSYKARTSEGNYSAPEVYTMEEDSMPFLYIVSTNNSWAMIAADDGIPPIFAYSFEGSFPINEDLPPAMSYFIEWYGYQVQQVRNSPEIVQRNTSSNSVSEPSPTVVVAPLLIKDGNECNWFQSGNINSTNASMGYNRYCPPSNTDYGACAHSVVGCVAVAMGQIMWYWEWPHVALVTDNDGSRVLREYDWLNMPYQLSSSSTDYQVQHIAHLLNDAGVAVGMRYGCNSSSATPDRIPNALRNVFHYHSSELTHRFSNDEDWINLLKQELQLGRPILYGGRRSGDRGHRFVIDGYNSANQFHVNYGWNDFSPIVTHNGYFSLNTINNNGDPYSSSQSAVLEVYPVSSSCTTSWINNILDDNAFYVNSSIYLNGITVNNGQHVVAYANNQIRVLPNSHFREGSYVHLAIKDLHCHETSRVSIQQLPQQEDVTPDFSSLRSRAVVTLSPNPVSDILTIAGCTSLTPELTIYSIHGQIMSHTIGTSVDVSALPKGIYLLICNDSNYIMQFKFLKE